MKKILLSLLAAAALAVSARAQNFAYLPALKPWVMEWDDANTSVVAFQLFYGTNAISILSTNDFVRLGVTNGWQTFQAAVPAILAGTNLVTLVAIDLAGQRSLPSLPLTLTVLGEPAAPQKLRKP
jgi:hypothetical protein